MVWIFENYISLTIEKIKNHEDETSTQGEYIRNHACIHSLQASRKKDTDSITMKFLLHKNKKNRNANAQNSISCKTHRPSHGTIFAARAVFLHTHVSSTKYRIKPKLFNHGL